MASGRPLNYTTTVPAKRTIAECQDMLAAAGASAVTVAYESKMPAGLRFELATPRGPRMFALPVNHPGVAALLRKVDADGGWPPTLRARERAKYLTPQHAVDVAWRVVRDWLEAQLAIVSAQMVTVEEVMLPYMLVAPGRTVFQAYESNQGALLPGGRND
jgi:hypothetical protein